MQVATDNALGPLSGAGAGETLGLVCGVGVCTCVVVEIFVSPPVVVASTFGSNVENTDDPNAVSPAASAGSISVCRLVVVAFESLGGGVLGVGPGGDEELKAGAGIGRNAGAGNDSRTGVGVGGITTAGSGVVVEEGVAGVWKSGGAGMGSVELAEGVDIVEVLFAFALGTLRGATTGVTNTPPPLPPAGRLKIEDEAIYRYAELLCEKLAYGA